MYLSFPISLPGDDLDRPPHPYDAGFEVNVAPPEPEQLTTPHTRADRHDHNVCEIGQLGSIDKSSEPDRVDRFLLQA